MRTVRWFRYRSTALLLLGVGVMSTDLPAQGVSLPVVNDLRSPVDTVRVRAFYRLLDSASAGVPRMGSLRPRVERLAQLARRDDAALTGLIDLLHLENRLGWAPRPGLDPEAFSNYYGDLVGAVAALEDQRAVTALIPVIDTGTMATNGLAALGEAAVPRVLEVLSSPDGGRRQGAAQTLGRIAERADELGVSGGSLSEIRSALLRLTDDSDPWVRRLTIMALAPFAADEEVRRRIQRIAETDSHAVMRGGVQVFPVREAARAWLREHRRPL